MRHTSWDIASMVIVSAVAIALAFLGLDSGIVPVLLGAPLVLLLPGYALMALASRTPSVPKRMLLSFVLSVGLTALGRWLLPQTPWGSQIDSWAVWLGGITLAAATGALIRDHARFQPPARRPAAMRSFIAGSFVCAVCTVFVGARVGPANLDSATLLERWSMPMGAPAPTPSAPSIASRSISVPAAAPAMATITPTPQPVPATATPVPTMTPVPTAAEPVPTTAAAPVLEDPTPASDVVVAERLKVALTDWPTRKTNTASMGGDADRYRLTLNGQPSVSVASVIPANSYRLTIDVAIEEGEAGLIFLAVEPATFYRLMFNTKGAYTMEQVQQNSTAVTSLVDWTPSPALQSSEQIRVRIERQNDMIKFFANDQPLTTFVVPPGQSTNQAGVALAAPSQHAQATFTALVVERLEKHTDTNR